MNVNELLNKYSKSTINNLKTDNMKKIIEFLEIIGCDFIEDIIEDYLDVFIIDYQDFKMKFNLLNEKYYKKYLKLIASNMNYLEEMFID